MTDIQKLRQYLQLQGIDDTTYTDEQLSLMISQATAFIGDEYVTPQEKEDYVRHFEGMTYMTDFYPVNVESVVVTVDDEEVTPHKITEEGLVYFENQVQGELLCTYLQAVDESIVEQAVNGVIMYSIRDSTGGNMKSINEGDISITYDTDNGMSTSSQISHLVDSLRQKFKARVRLI